MQYLSTKLLIAFLLALPFGGRTQDGNGNEAQGKCPPHEFEHTSASDVALAKCHEPELIEPICSKPSAPCGSNNEASSAAPEASSQAPTDSSATPASSTLLDIISAGTTVSKNGCVCTCPASASSPAPESSSPASEGSSPAESSSAPEDCPTEATTSEPTCTCILVEELKRICKTLSIEFQVIFEQLIIEIEAIIDDDMEECGCSDEMKIKLKLAKIGICVSKFLEEHEEIAEECQYAIIAEWGTIHMLIECGIAYQEECEGDELDVTDEETGECNFTKSIKEQCSNNELGPGSSEVILEYVEIVEYVCLRWLNAGYQKGRLWGWFSISFEIFCEEHPELKEALLKCKLSYGLTVEEFLHLCEWYEAVYSCLVVFSGSAEYCPLIVTLEDGSDDCECSPSVSLEIEEYVQELKSNFSLLSSEEERFDCFVASFSELSYECQSVLMKLVVKKVTIKITVGELFGIGCNCENDYACGNMSEGGCGESYKETVLVDSKNHSSMVHACQDYKNNSECLNTTTLKNQFTTYLNAITNCVYNESTDGDLDAKLACVWDIVNKTYTQTYMIHYRKCFQSQPIYTVCDQDEPDTVSGGGSTEEEEDTTDITVTDATVTKAAVTDDGYDFSDESSDSSNDDDDDDDCGYGTIGDGCECECSQQQEEGGVCEG